MVRIASGIIVAVVVACGGVFASPGGTVSGSILTPLSRPIDKAEVRLVSVFSGTTVAKTESDADGTFTFAQVGPGSYGIEASNQKACAISRAFSVSQDAKIVVTLRLVDRKACSDPVTFAQPAIR
jgi:hypothetical protein